LITVDTEIWCWGWRNIDSKFKKAFTKYIYGTTARGDWGLPFLFRHLADNNINAVFFIEALFAVRFGVKYLKMIVNMIHDAGHFVELHLHPEWADEANVPLINTKEKKQYLCQFTLDEQIVLISKGVELMHKAGVDNIHAFRAGSFGANNDTLKALKAVGINCDSSFNSVIGPSELKLHNQPLQPLLVDGLLEVPMTTFTDGIGRPRQAAVTACSFNELHDTLNNAYYKGWETYVILTHSFEFLNNRLNRHNPIVADRFIQLCRFLGENKTKYVTCGFNGIQPTANGVKFDRISCNASSTVVRLKEQIQSRLMIL